MKSSHVKNIPAFLGYFLFFAFLSTLKAVEPDGSSPSYITSDEIGVEMIGGIIAKTSTDFFEQASNPKSVLLLKIDGSLQSFKVGQSFKATYEKKPYTFTIFHIYNKYHMKLSYLDGDSEKYYEVVRVGFSNKRARLPKKTSPAPQANPISGSYAEDGFERNFDGSSGLVEMTGAYRENIKKNLSAILMQAAATPVLEKQAIIGFMLEEIDPDSMFEKAGFQDGDIVTSIKGRPLNNAATAIKILNSLKDADEIDFEFLRAGQSYQVSVVVQ